MTVINHLLRKVYILAYIYILIVNPAIIRKPEEGSKFRFPDLITDLQRDLQTSSIETFHP